jgi:general stress protein YciG
MVAHQTPSGADSRPRGFASMDPARQRQIASQGGRAAHQQGTAHEFDSEEARVAGRKGGEVVSRDRAHMSQIGRKGGEASGGGRTSRGGQSNSENNMQNRVEQSAEQVVGAERVS